MSDSSPGTHSSVSSPDTHGSSMDQDHEESRELDLEHVSPEHSRPGVIVENSSVDAPLDFSIKATLGTNSDKAAIGHGSAFNPVGAPPNLFGFSGAPNNGQGANQFSGPHGGPMLPSLPGLGMINPALLAAAAAAAGGLSNLQPFSLLPQTSFNPAAINFSAPNSQSESCGSPSAKVPRPFKAYNPGDPLSALQVPNLALSSLSTDNFLNQYRQYLNNQQQNLIRTKSVGEEKPVAPVRKISPTTPSPPQQVTSTSYPHMDERANGVLGPASSLQSAAHPTLAASISTPPIKLQPGTPRPMSVLVPNVAVQPPSVARSGGTTTDSGGDSGAESGSGGKPARRRPGAAVPNEVKDEAYWERRRKNNDAAKRSRDARRQKEDEIAMRAAILEQENLRLRMEVAQLKTETEKLRQLLLST